MAKDAARYQYLKSRMQSHALHMDGVASYRFRGGWPELRGVSVDEAVDTAMEAEQAERLRQRGGA